MKIQLRPNICGEPRSKSTAGPPPHPCPDHGNIGTGSDKTLFPENQQCGLVTVD